MCKPFKKSITLVLSFFLLVLPTLSQAEDCLRDARLAKQAGIDHLLISFEGLASYGSGFVRNGLIKKLSPSAQRRIVSKNYAYTSTSSALKCLQSFQAEYPSGSLQIILLGHSFGGGISVFEFLSKTKSKIQTVLTLDPRSWNGDSIYRRTKDLMVFQMPANVEKTFNFYQRGGMGGYQVRGAKNQILQNTRHTAVPRDPGVKALLENIILDR